MQNAVALTRGLAVLVIAVVAGCASDSAPNRPVIEAVQLVTSATPRLSLGVVDGDERYMFVRVTSAWKQRNGRIVVLDPGKAALLFYDSTGTFLFQAGGRGQGPGEMQMLAGGWPYRGDSIAVFDVVLRRLSVYSPDGVYARSFQLPMTYTPRPGTVPSQSCCSLRAVFTDGSFVGHPPDDIPIGTGPDRFSMFTPWWISPDGAQTIPIGTYESVLFYHDPGRRSGVSGYATSYSFRYVAVGDRLIGGNGFDSRLVSVQVVPNDTGISVAVDTLTAPHESLPFSVELQTAYENAVRADYELRPSHYEGSLESNLPNAFPATTPAFVNIHADADGRIWLERWTPEYGRTGARLQYDLIDTAGSHLATVELEPGSRLLWAAGRQVLLLQRNTDDVQFVRLYDLEPRDTVATLTSQ